LCRAAFCLGLNSAESCFPARCRDCDDAAIEERSLVAAGKASRGSVGMTT